MDEDELLTAQELMKSIDNGSKEELKSLFELAHSNPKIFIHCEKYFQLGIDLNINLSECLNDIGIIKMVKNQDPTPFFQQSYELKSENGLFDYAIYTSNAKLLKKSSDEFNNSFSMLFYFKLTKDLSYLQKSAIELQNPFSLILYGLYLHDHPNTEINEDSEEENENDWQSILTQGALLTKPGDKFNLLPFPSILYYDKNFVNSCRNNIKRAADIGNPHNAFLYAYMSPDLKTKAYYYRLSGDLGLTEGYYQYCQLIRNKKSLLISEQFESIPQNYKNNESQDNFSQEMKSFIDYQNSIFDVTNETVPSVAEKLVHTVNDVKSIYNVIHNIMLAIDYRPYESNLHALANLATSLHFMILDESLQNLFRDLIIQESCSNTNRNRSRFYFLEICIENFIFTMDYLCRAALYMKLHRTENYNRYVELWFPEIRRFMREFDQEEDDRIDLHYYFNDPEFHCLPFVDQSLESEDFIIKQRNLGNPDPYAVAIRKDDLIALQKLIISTKAMSVNHRINPSFFELSAMLDKRPSLLCYAAFYNAEKCFCYLLENEANLSFFDDECLTVSAYAAASGSIRILARIEVRNELDHQMAAEFAALYHRGKILHRLMEGKTIISLIYEERNITEENKRVEALIKQEIKQRQMQQDLVLKNILEQQERFLQEQENQNKHRMKMQQQQQTQQLEKLLIEQQKKIQKEKKSAQQNSIDTQTTSTKNKTIQHEDNILENRQVANNENNMQESNISNTQNNSNELPHNENNISDNKGNTDEKTNLQNGNSAQIEHTVNSVTTHSPDINIKQSNSPEHTTETQSIEPEENDELYSVNQSNDHPIEINEKDKELIMNQLNEIKKQLSQNTQTPLNHHEIIQNLKRQTIPDNSNIENQSQIKEILRQQKNIQKTATKPQNQNQNQNKIQKQHFNQYEHFLSNAENRMKTNLSQKRHDIKPTPSQNPNDDKPKKRVSFFNKYADLEKERLLLEENRRKKQLQDKLEREKEKRKQLSSQPDGLMEGLDLPPQIQLLISQNSQPDSFPQNDSDTNETDDDINQTDVGLKVDDIEQIVLNGLLSDFVESLKYIELKIEKKSVEKKKVKQSLDEEEEEEEEEEADDLDDEDEDGLPIFDDNYQSDDEDESISTFYRICENGNSGVVKFLNRQLWQRMLIESIYGESGDTVFTRLASLGNYDMIDELMQHDEVKKMLTVSNKVGLTPYEIASGIENQDVIDILDFYLDES